jgi:transcription antitermination factor NusA-like protein
MRINCTCGNAKKLSNKMDNFEIRIIRHSSDSKTLVISVVRRLCGKETKQMLLEN